MGKIFTSKEIIYIKALIDQLKAWGYCFDYSDLNIIYINEDSEIIQIRFSICGYEELFVYNKFLKTSSTY